MNGVLIAAATATALVGLFFVLTTHDVWLAGGLLGVAALLAFIGARQ